MVIASMDQSQSVEGLGSVLPFPTQRRHSGSSSASFPERLRPSTTGRRARGRRPLLQAFVEANGLQAAEDQELMRTLVTGGAGFIGTHLVRALVERGDEVVVLDSLEPQVHGDAQPDLPAGVELIVGNVGDRDARRRAPWRAPSASCTSPPPSASASRCTRSRATPSSTRWPPRASSSTSWPSARCPSRMVVASSMSIYGEGEYVCEEHGRVAPGPRPEEQLLARAWETRLPDLRARAASRSARARPSR